jgi:phosphatidylserine/phosphatidylglycerophosphate/cardiolipin synthase-like enzyme
MAEPKCRPDYWFVTFADSPSLKDRYTSLKDVTEKEDKKGTRETLFPYVGLAYTCNNNVTALVDGEEYLQDLWRTLDGAFESEDESGLLLIAGWEFWVKRHANIENAIGATSTSPSPLYRKTLGEMLCKPKNKGKVRLISYDNALASRIPFVGTNWNKELVDSLNAYLSDGHGTIAELDQAKMLMSHHQKTVVVCRKDFEDSCAYVGGVDLGKDRLDNGGHSKSAAEKRFVAWHDIQAKVYGPAVLQILANFVQRWESLRKSHPRMKPCPIPWEKDELPFNPKLQFKDTATQAVQVLRTVGPASGKQPQRFLQGGETTVRDALIKAISLAERYIYIEDQFLWKCELAKHIRDRMKKEKNLQLIIVLAAETELPGHPGEYNYYLRSGFFRDVMPDSSNGKIEFGFNTRVHVFGLYQLPEYTGKAIYVHSKLVLIDDRYVAIGSANVNERSLSIETELSLAIVDFTTVEVTWGGKKVWVCRFAKELRDKLWKEHSGLNINLLNDPHEALKQCFPPYCDPKADDEWPGDELSAKRGAKHHLRCYVNKLGKNIQHRTTRRLFDRSHRWWFTEKVRKHATGESGSLNEI